MMAELKTRKTDANVEKFVNSVENKIRKEDAKVLLKLFREITKEEPAMWGDSIIGYGSYHYKSERSNQEGDWPLTGFSPRKQRLSIYIMPGFKDFGELLKNLGKYRNSVSCLYINKLADVDIKVLKEIIKKGYQDMKARS